MDALRVQCQKLVSQQRGVFSSSIDQLDQLLAQLQDMQESLTSDADARPQTSASAQAANVSRLAAECRTRLPKDFKLLFTNIGKLSSKIDKTCSLDLDDLCPNPLDGSPAFLAARSANGVEADGASPPGSFDDSSSSAGAHYCRSLEQVMEDSWLRDGRMELVESLRAESAIKHDEPSASASASTAQPPVALSASASPPDSSRAPNEFQQLHAMIGALRRRDTETCMQWVLERREQMEREMAQVSEELELERQAHTRHKGAQRVAQMEGDADGSMLPSPSASYGRRRVSFTGQGQRVDVDSPPSPPTSSGPASAASSSAARVSSLGTRLSSLQSSVSSLRSLQFDLHRLRFLQILIDTEADARRASQTASNDEKRGDRALVSRKRKGNAQRAGTTPRKQPSANQSQRVRREGAGAGVGATPARSMAQGSSDVDADVDVDMGGGEEEEEEAEALAADRSSPSGNGDEDEESRAAAAADADADAIDADLNAIATAGRRTVGLTSSAPSVVTAPSSYSYHAALAYAQRCFPPFADTHMDAIRSLSGCLLFLGELTPSSSVSAPPSHPYASLFSRSGNARLWHDVMRTAKRMAFQHIHKPERDPVTVWYERISLAHLRACDVSLPQLLKYQSVRKLNREFIQGVEANPEVDVGVDLEFHSTLICPVTKEQCTRTASAQRGAPDIQTPQQQHSSMHALIQHLQQQAQQQQAQAQGQVGSSSQHESASPSSSSSPSYSNPPVLLKCGHCISQHAVEKIVRNLRLSRRFKCPTCPQEQSHTDVLVLHL